MSAGGTNVKRRGRPPRVDAFVPAPALWESEAVATQLQDILNALEVPPIDAQTRRTLQRMLHRHDKYFGGDGRGHVIFLIRCILESSGNEDALIEPIVSAVSVCLKPEWTDRGVELIEAFDKIPLIAILETMRGLDLFGEQSLAHYYSIAIRNKLAAILEPADAIGIRKCRAVVKSGRPRTDGRPGRYRRRSAQSGVRRQQIYDWKRDLRGRRNGSGLKAGPYAATSPTVRERNEPRAVWSKQLIRVLQINGQTRFALYADGRAVEISGATFKRGFGRRCAPVPHGYDRIWCISCSSARSRSGRP
jgi:hypothetical protein